MHEKMRSDIEAEQVNTQKDAKIENSRQETTTLEAAISEKDAMIAWLCQTLASTITSSHMDKYEYESMVIEPGSQFTAEYWKKAAAEAANAVEVPFGFEQNY